MIMFIAIFTFLIGMAVGFFSGYHVGLGTGMMKPRIPKTIDYSNIIEVGDTIGFKYATYYMEAVVDVILTNKGLCDDDEDEYVVKIIRDDDPHRIFSMVGRIITMNMKYRRWTIIKKNPNRPNLIPVIQQQGIV